MEELYGDFDLATNEWTDGVLSSVMRNTCLDESKATGHMDKWILFDGPVDTVWIESMNSVMDDNKILTLINGERINMPENVILLFETQDLSQVNFDRKYAVCLSVLLIRPVTARTIGWMDKALFGVATKRYINMVSR